MRKIWKGGILVSFLLCIVYLLLAPKFLLDNGYIRPPAPKPFDIPYIGSYYKSVNPVHGNSTPLLCAGLVQGKKVDQLQADAFMNAYSRVPLKKRWYTAWTKNCTRFRHKRGYIMNVSEEELSFPLAFSILLYKDAEQVERLLRAIYRPQNHYCIHVDAKASDDTKMTMASVVACLPGVFLAPDPVEVWWGTFSILEAELKCLRSLMVGRKWRYFINLTGQEFPLKTNRQLVEILKTYDGANDVEGLMKGVDYDLMFNQRWKRAMPAPLKIKPIKGSTHMAINRQFAYFAVYNETSKALAEWVRKTHIPDETFFNTLNYNQQLHLPGAFSGNVKNKVFANTRYKMEIDTGSCSGKFVRGVCIYGVGDLPRLTSAPMLFANKLYVSYQPLTLDCLEEWYFGLVHNETLGIVQEINRTVYRDLDFVKSHFPLWSVSMDDIGFNDVNLRGRSNVTHVSSDETTVDVK